jgi:hypothetical protein
MTFVKLPMLCRELWTAPHMALPHSRRIGPGLLLAALCLLLLDPPRGIQDLAPDQGLAALETKQVPLVSFDTRGGGDV